MRRSRVYCRPSASSQIHLLEHLGVPFDELHGACRFEESMRIMDRDTVELLAHRWPLLHTSSQAVRHWSDSILQHCSMSLLIQSQVRVCHARMESMVRSVHLVSKRPPNLVRRSPRPGQYHPMFHPRLWPYLCAAIRRPHQSRVGVRTVPRPTNPTLNQAVLAVVSWASSFPKRWHQRTNQSHRGEAIPP